MQKKTFISKVFQMSSVMLFLNISNILYNMFVSRRAGAEGIGMFYLVMSVYSLGVTFSVSGINLTATRLISDMSPSLSQKCAGAVSIKCMRLICIPAIVASFTVFSSADYVAINFLKKKECAICLKLMATTLVPVGLSSVITGYFTAFGNVGAISCGRAVSETVTWSATMFLFKIYPPSQTYMVVILSICAGTFSECMCNLFLWWRTLNPLYCKKGADYRSILRLCTPIALGSYLRTGLSSAENLLIPSMLAVFGVVNPVSQYGIIKGMTLPILMFPTVFTAAFSSLIVPEIARRRAMGFKNGIKYISGLSIEYILKFGFFISAVFFKWHSFLGIRFFGEPDAGKYLGILFVFPLFYFCDSVVDSILKGLDQQVASLKINITDSICRVACTVILLPRFGMWGYIAILYLSETINLMLSYLKLKKVSDVKFPFKKGVFIPLVSVIIAFLTVNIVNFTNPWADICAIGAVYIAVLRIINSKAEQ